MPTTLKDLRAQLGLTQRELGQRIGVRHSQVANWECGKERVPPVHRSRIAAMLNNADIDWDIPRVPRKKTRPVPLRVLFTVQGSTGERDDRQVWTVGDPCPTLEPAQEAAMRLNTWCSLHHLYADGDRIAPWCQRDAAVCPLDTEFVCDYTGTRYDVVPVLVSVPRAK
jgi:transcriptional regulator with XRE-family HTH domain